MLDCACLAGIVALKHFRRPDVEVIGEEVTVVRVLPFPILVQAYNPPDSTASPHRTRPRPTSNQPHAFLLHVRLLPRYHNAARPRSQPARAAAQRRFSINSAERAKGDLRAAKTRRDPSGYRRHPCN